MTTTSDDIPLVRVSGDARERGLALGKQIKERIHKTVRFYEENIFLNSPLNSADIRQRADLFERIIKQYNEKYCIEIEAMAEAAEIDAWRLYCLNARTEILNAPVAECTSVVFKQTRLIGQTWDWIKELEDLVVLVEHEYPNGQRLMTLTEPGMLAKIGLNDRGLGLCINILISEHELDGLPVHVLTRAILESDNVADARSTIESSGMGKSSHFLVGDAGGDVLSMEFAAGSREEIEISSNAYLHTNHCLAKTISSQFVPSTRERFNQGQNQLKEIESYSSRDMNSILLDDTGSGAIQTTYHSEEALGGLYVGTCATVLMDLDKRQFHLKKGPDSNRGFTTYSL